MDAAESEVLWQGRCRRDADDCADDHHVANGRRLSVVVLLSIALAVEVVMTMEVVAVVAMIAIVVEALVARWAIEVKR